jgi:hypothetical protein
VEVSTVENNRDRNLVFFENRPRLLRKYGKEKKLFRPRLSTF